jgi:hypothetical protein
LKIYFIYSKQKYEKENRTRTKIDLNIPHYRKSTKQKFVIHNEIIIHCQKIFFFIAYITGDQQLI